MSDYKFKNIPLNELFSSVRGNSKYTKEFCNKHKGIYEVYTGTTIGTFAKIDSYEYDGENISYTTDGEYTGTVSILQGKYNVCGHRVLLIPKDSNIDLLYFKYVLEPYFKKVKRSNCVPTVTWQLIKNLSIPVPVITGDQYDLEAQIEIALKYKKVESHRKSLLKDKDILVQSDVEIDISAYKYNMVEVQNLFDLSKSQTNGSKFTLSFINEHSGDIPVYGAVKFDNKPSYGYVEDNVSISETINGKTRQTKVKYFENCLTYNIDGQGGCGYIFYRKGRFSLSEKVKPLPIKLEYIDSIHPLYLKYILQPLFLSNVRGRKITKQIIKDLQIPIPVNKNGSFDLNAQKVIASRYGKIIEIKQGLCKQIDKVLEIELEF